MSTIKAIETHYNGYRFRSRLEARWAVFFDTLGIEYEYEPQGFEFEGGVRYLPDFWLPQVSMWAEVKPGIFSDEDLSKCVAIHAATGYECLLLEGTPSARSYFSTMKYEGEDSSFVDYVMGCGHMYHLYEGRFYASTGEGEYPVGANCEDEDNLVKAVAAARSARFEFGETPKVRS